MDSALRTLDGGTDPQWMGVAAGAGAHRERAPAFAGTFGRVEHHGCADARRALRRGSQRALGHAPASEWDVEVGSIRINVGNHSSSEAPRYQAVPPAHRAVTVWARTRARLIAANVPGANACFESLSGGRSLSQMLADEALWINFASEIEGCGEVAGVGATDLAIGPRAYSAGRWTVLGTLIRELAHLNGALGHDSAAEQALLQCGLSNLRDPGPTP